MGVAAASSATAAGGKAGDSRPAELHGLHRAPRKPPRNRRKGRRRRPKPQLKTQCEQQYKSLQQEVLGFLISSQLGDRRSELAGREGHRQGSQEAVRENQEPAVPEGRGIRKIPEDVRAERLRPAAAREAEPAVAENPAEDRQTEAESHAGADREVLQRKQIALRDAGKAQPAIILTKTEAAGEEGQAGNRIGQELRERRQEASRSTRRARPTAASSRASSKARRRSRSTKRSSRPRRTCSAGPSRRRSATTSSRSQKITPGSQQSLTQVKRRSSRS